MWGSERVGCAVAQIVVARAQEAGQVSRSQADHVSARADHVSARAPTPPASRIAVSSTRVGRQWPHCHNLLMALTSHMLMSPVFRASRDEAVRLRGMGAVALCFAALWVGVQMLWSGTFFRAFYAARMPWVHGVIATFMLAVGCAGLVRLFARSGALPFLRRHILKLFTAAAIALVIVAVSHQFRALPDVEGANRSAVAYLDKSLRSLERTYVGRDQVDWSAVRRAAFDKARGAVTPQDTFPAIVAALDMIGDRHNILLTSDWRQQFKGGGAWATTPARTRTHLTHDRVAYVAVPSFVGSGGGSLYELIDEDGRAYADSLRQALRRLDDQAPIGWIVDLRHNMGGNMWPMLDGLAGLIGEGCVGSIEMPQIGRRVETWIVNGRATSGPPSFAGLTPWEHPSPLGYGDAPVVVLVGQHTASSGEAVVVALSGRPRTRLMGGPTAGVPTALQGLSLGAGAELMVTVGRLADRSGRIYDGPIRPDELHPAASTPDLIAVATQWIRAQGS